MENQVLPWNSLIKELFKKFTKPFQSLKVTFEISAEIKPKKYKRLLASYISLVRLTHIKNFVAVNATNVKANQSAIKSIIKTRIKLTKVQGRFCNFA